MHGVNEAGEVVLRRRLRRSDVLRLFIEIEPAILGSRHVTRPIIGVESLGPLDMMCGLMPSQFVKPYVRSQKNDAADAEESARPSNGRPCALFRSRAQSSKLLCCFTGRTLREVAARVRAVEARLLAWHRANDVSRRLATIPAIGPITASAIAPTVVDANQFSSGSQFAAWLGLVRQQHSPYSVRATCVMR